MSGCGCVCVVGVGCVGGGGGGGGWGGVWVCGGASRAYRRGGAIRPTTR